jgi:signal transduction histidine kinase
VARWIGFINPRITNKERDMRKKSIIGLVVVSCFLIGATLAFAQAKPDDAQAWVKKGVEFYKANGKDKAMAAFNDPKGQFVKEDLYIYVLDLNGKMLAHPNASLVGQDFMVKKDADGKLFAVDMVKMAKEKGSGWVDYKWDNPVKKCVDPKTVYFEKVDDVIIASGAYKK